MDDAVLPELPERPRGGGLPVVAAAVVAAATVLLFWPVTGFSLLDLGDADLLVVQDRWHGFADGRLGWQLGTARGGLPRPLAWMSFALDFVLHGDSAAGLHLTSLVLHAGTAALLCLLGVRVFRRDATPGGGPVTHDHWPIVAAAVAATLWAVHPLRIEPVAWVSARGELVGAAAFAAAALAFRIAWDGERVKRGALLLTLVLLTAMLAADPGLWAAPVALLALFADLRRSRPESAAARVRPGRSIAIGLVAMIPCAVVAAAAYSALPRGSATPVTPSLLSACAAIVRPLLAMFWPSGLHPALDPPTGFPDVIAPELWTQAGLAVLLCVAIASGLRGRHPAALAGLAYVALCGGSWLLGRDPLGSDRAVHAASLPLALLAAGTVLSVGENRGAVARVAGVAAAACVLAALGWTTARGLPAWATDTTLSERVLTFEPTNEWALSSRAEHVRRARGEHGQSDVEAAAALHRRSLEFGDHRARAHTGLARCLLDLGEPAEARRHLERAIAVAPWAADAQGELGGLLLREGEFDAALLCLRAATRIDDQSAEAWFALGRTLLMLDRRDEAAEAFEVVLALRPGDARAQIEFDRLRAQ